MSMQLVIGINISKEYLHVWPLSAGYQFAYDSQKAIPSSYHRLSGACVMDIEAATPTGRKAHYHLHLN